MVAGGHGVGKGQLSVAGCLNCDSCDSEVDLISGVSRMPALQGDFVSPVAAFAQALGALSLTHLLACRRSG